ncbi:hypothetical protein PLESTF_001031900 [Pleodorina starrii]|nr:hypothetical protein PLESTF_001031900 [Pleodorina starrii]
MSDDSDVSAISLSGDDEPKPKAAAPPKAAPKTTAGAAGSNRAASTGAAAGGVSKPASSKASKSERRNRRVAFQLDEDDEQSADDDGADEGTAQNKWAARRSRGRGGDADADDDGDEEDGAVEDESKPLGWSYFRKRDASEGPATWDEVDIGELRFVAENLVRSTTKRASQADDVMQQIFQAAPGDEDSLVPDPLGRGVIDPVTLTLGKRSKMQAARQAQPSSGEKGLKATMRTFRTARLTKQQQQKQHGGAEGAGGRQPADAAAAAGSALDEEARKVLPNQEGFDPEAYLATFHSESGMTQLDKGLRSLSRELSERTGQLKQLIRNNFERFINCKDAIEDIHAKMRKTLVRGGGSGAGAGGGGAGGGGAGGVAPPLPAGSGPAGAAAAAQQQQQQQVVATERVFRSLEQVETAARRTFGPILDRAAKADRIRAVASLLQRFDHLFAAPQRVMELAGRGELEQVVREYKRANMLIRPTPTTARVWVSLYAEIEKRVTEVYLAVKQLVTEPPPEDRPMGQDGPVALFGVAVPPATAPSVGSAAAASRDDTSRQRLSLLPDYLLFLALVRQERLPAAREEDAMRLYVSRLETHVVARMQDCDKQHTERLGQLVSAWMRSAAGGGSGAAAGTGTAASGAAASAAAAALRAAASGIASLQASFTALPRLDAPAAAGAGAGGIGPTGDSRGKAQRGGGEGEESGGRGADGEEGGGGGDGGSDGEVDDLDDEGEAAEAAFLLWHGGALVSAPASAFMGGHTANLPYHIRTELRRLVQEPGGPYGNLGGEVGGGLQADGGGGGAAEPLPSSAHAPEPALTPAQRQWVSYVCSVSALLLWSLPGLWATCNSPKYGNNADLNDEAREGLQRGPSLARRLVESLCTKYAARLRRAAQSLARAGPMQPGLALIIKDGCHVWSCLRRVGIGGRPLTGLRGAVLAALGAWVRGLSDHLAELPQLLFGADDFRLDLLAADQQPVTSLPRRLEEELGVVLLHYQWPLAAVVEAAGGAGEVPADASWRPVQGSVFACFSLLSEALAEYARSLYGSHLDGRSSLRSKASGSTELESTSSVASVAGGPTPTTPRQPGSGHRPSLAGRASSGAAVAAAGGRPVRITDGGASDAGGAAENGGPTRGSLWSAGGGFGGGGGGSDDVRVLLVIGNSAVIRTRVMPGVVERYRRLLAPTPDAASTCQRRLRELTSGMRRSNEALGSTYLERKEADVQAAVEAYMQEATAPLLPAAAAAAAAGAGGASAGAAPKRSARTGTGAAATAAVAGRGLLAGPSGPSAGCCSLLQLLTAIHNEALAYSPSNLRSFMEALAERLVAELAPACARLAAATAAASAASVEQLVQVWADLRFLTAALRPLLSEELGEDLEEAKVDVGGAIAARQRARRYRPASAPAAALADLLDGEAVSEALEELLASDVDSWMRLHALNVRCFAAATTPAAPAVAAINPASTAGGAGAKGARGTGPEASSSSAAAASSPTGSRREAGGAGDGAGRRQLSPRREAGRAGSRAGAAARGAA